MKFTRGLVRTAGVVTAAVALTIGAASTSSAATARASCSTTGASGAMSINFGSPFDKMPVSLSVTDTSADGHHVRVRLVTQKSDYNKVYWRWHSLTAGSGKSLSIDTSAQDNQGIYNAAVQVARFEGDTMLNSCTSNWA
ncbi:hypothetical protein [Streptomyces incanus]|uniref:Secreted protein n=1 Tax=Streptomyces incanus TaxID=887453 RepID=A0ABW0XZY2_9ACTN